MAGERSTALYGVIVCPRCRAPRGVRLAQKTALCGRCGRRLALARVRVWERVADESALPAALGRVAQARDGGALADADERAPPPPPQPPGGQLARLRAALPDGEFTEAEALACAAEAAVPPERARELLARLLATGELYEPRPGRFVTVRLK